MRRPPLAALRHLTSAGALALACSGANSSDFTGDGASAPAAASSHGGASSREAGAPGKGDGGTGGGTLARLAFAVVGDTRPATIDDTSGYPATVVTTIYSSIQALKPRPPFVLSTGDYLFASAPVAGEPSQAGPQLDIYLQARARYSGTLFPAMGNHECTGATNSNCGAAGANGVTANYAAFLEKMLAPIGQSAPYYAFDVRAVDGSWTAKFVLLAANAWSPAQSGWLETTLSRPTTYTFIVRHEPASAITAPGVTPSEVIMARHPYTLAIVGHSHTYAHSPETPREVLLGNGGAPLTSKDYGFGLFGQRADGAIVVDEIHWQTGVADPNFHFVVRPDGSPW